jgi:hypothetical protein
VYVGRWVGESKCCYCIEPALGCCDDDDEEEGREVTIQRKEGRPAFFGILQPSLLPTCAPEKKKKQEKRGTGTLMKYTFVLISIFIYIYIYILYRCIYDIRMYKI